VDAAGARGREEQEVKGSWGLSSYEEQNKELRERTEQLKDAVARNSSPPKTLLKEAMEIIERLEKKVNRLIQASIHK
jgi:hypothetical protein